MTGGLCWIPNLSYGRLAIMPRPRAGDWLPDEIAAWKQAGVEVIVSLLCPEEIAELGLEAEAELCQSSGLEFVSFPISDRGVPRSVDEFTQLLQSLDRALKAGHAVAVHCRAGIGRSTLVAAALLTRQGLSLQTALSVITRARGVPVPDTAEQIAWLQRFIGC